MSTLIKEDFEIHTFRIESKRFAFLVNSLDFAEIDEIVWDILSLGKKHSEREIVGILGKKYEKREIASAMSALKQLCADLEEISEESTSNEFDPNIMLLQISHACNLRCNYCFSQQVDYCRDEQLMSEEVGKRAVDFFVRRSKDERLRITFFGGEPLMNLPVIRSIVRYAKHVAGDYNKKITFRLSTNGTLLHDETITFLARNDFDSIQISLDGPPEIHDRNRPFISKKGSFGAVIQGVRKVMESPLGKSPSRRVTLNAGYTNGQLGLYETFLFLAGMGSDGVSMYPYFLPNLHPSAVANDHIKRLRKEYRKIGMFCIEFLIQKGQFYFTPLADKVRQLIDKENLTRGCGAGLRSFAVSPNGDIFPCQLLDGKEEYKMGSVFGDVDGDQIKKWRESPISVRNRCRSCWARHLCGGGCRAWSILFSDGMGNTYDAQCTMEMPIVEEAIYLVSELEERKLLEYATTCLHTQRT